MDPATIAAFGAAIVAIIGAITTAAVKILTVLKEIKTSVNGNHQATLRQIDAVNVSLSEATGQPAPPPQADP